MIKKSITFCVCDFETTGLDYEKDYPIEVGCLFTDSNFVVKDIYSSLIYTKELKEEIIENSSLWPEKYLPAYKVHKIQPNEMFAGKRYEQVAEEITTICNKIKTKYKAPILLSDNPSFETNFMTKIFNKANMKFPFHYNTWGSDLFLEVVGVGDPIPIHRALPDAALLHQAVIRGIERINGFNNEVRRT